MSKTVRIPVILSDGSGNERLIQTLKDTIHYPERCIYCGSPKNREHAITVKNSVKKTGEKKLVNYTFQTKIPYCDEHAEQTKKFGFLLVGVGAFVALAFIPLLAYSALGVMRVFVALTGENWMGLVMGVLSLVAIAAVLGFLAAAALKRILGYFIPALKEFRMDYGLGFSVELSEPDEEADLPLRTLDFTFFNDEFAAAFEEINYLEPQEIRTAYEELPLASIDQKEEDLSSLLTDTPIKQFYENTLTTWREGKLSAIDPAYEIEADTTYEAFIEKYRPVEGGSLHIFFAQFIPQSDEYLVGVTDWFVLTNLRLIQRDGETKTFKEIRLAEVDRFKIKGKFIKSIKFKLKSGKTINCTQIQMYPKEEILRKLIKQTLTT